MTAKLADDHWTMGVSHAWSMEALMKMARAEAEQAGQTDLEKAVFNGGLSPSIHLNHQFRYGGFGMVQMPPLAETLEALTALYNELHNPLLAALAREAQN